LATFLYLTSTRFRLLFHRYGDVAVRREPNLVTFHVGNKTAIEVVVMTFVAALTTVGLR
jgi:hypothetical protein